MSVASPLLLTDWNGVRDSLAELAASHDQVARFLSTLFDQLDALWTDLLRRQRAWQTEQERARQELASRAEDLDRQRAEVAVQRERLREEARHEAQEHLRGAEQEQSLRDQERMALETELDAVRGRAAELAETIAQQQRQIAEERALWSDELKRMRRLLETLAQQPGPPAAAPGARLAPAPAERRPVAPVPAAVLPRSPSPGDDPVLNSVMAQFEMLQKDLSRRKRNGDGG